MNVSRKQEWDGDEERKIVAQVIDDEDGSFPAMSGETPCQNTARCRL
jgi:hypothetical protein